MGKINWVSLLLKIAVVAVIAIVVYYLTAGSNIASIATIGAVGVGVWLAFFRKGGLKIGGSNGTTPPRKNGRSRSNGANSESLLA